MAVKDSTIVILEEMRAFLNLEDSDQVNMNDILIDLLDAYNGKIENYLGVTMINTVYASEKYDGEGTDYLFLDHYPIISVTALSIDGTALSVVEGTDFHTYNTEGYIRLDSSIFTTTDLHNVVITYSAGWGEERDDVSDVLKNTLKTWVARVFKAEIIDFNTKFDESSLANIKSQMMPWDIKQDLDYYRCRHWGNQ